MWLDRMRHRAALALLPIGMMFGMQGELRGQVSQSEVAPPAHSDERRSQSNVAEDETLDWLSRNRYSRRQQATLDMWRDRERSRELVQEAARHPDPEVSGRAKWILRQWRRGALPDTPPAIAKLLQASESPAAVERLLEGGQFTAALVAVEESAGTIDREAVQSRIGSALTRRFPIYIHLALAKDSLDELLKLVDLVADSKELALCRVELMQLLGIDVTAENLLPTAASLWSPSAREQAEVLLWMVLGEVDRAISLAERSVNDNLLHQCRMIAGRWQDAAEESLRQARLAQPGNYEYARLWCLAFISADRAGDADIRSEAISALTDTTIIDSDEGRLASELRWKCLASHGEVDAALAIVSQTNPEAAAAVCLDASRTERAFTILGFPLDRLDLDLDQWIDHSIESQRQFNEADLSPEMRQVLALMQCLISIGRHDAAWTIASRLADAKISIDTLRLREYVLSTLSMTQRSEWVVPLAVGKEDQSLTPQTSSAIARVLPDCDLISFDNLVHTLSLVMVDASLQQRVQAAAALYRGEIPDQFDPATGFRRIYELISAPRSSPTIGGSSFGKPGMAESLAVVSLFARHGEAALATQCLQNLVVKQDSKALFFMAEQELDGGRTETAEALFEAVFDLVHEETRVSGRFGGSDDVALAVKSKIGLWIIARRNGDELRSRELEQDIRLSLCAPSTRVRTSIAEYLGEREETTLALEVFERILPMTVFGNDDRITLYDVARAYAPLAHKSHGEAAAHWFDLAVSGTLDAIEFRPSAYITLPLLVRRWAAEAAIGRNDSDEVKQHLERILQLDPLDIDFAERLLPMMRERGMDELADQTLDRIMDQGVEYGRKFPFDAMTNNNVAWAAAMNQSRLDEALELAERAVHAEPESAIYRDTLAEVLFLLGRTQEALQIEQGCVLDDPSQWHLHQQIEKYAQAIAQGSE